MSPFLFPSFSFLSSLPFPSLPFPLLSSPLPSPRLNGALKQTGASQAAHISNILVPLAGAHLTIQARFIKASERLSSDPLCAVAEHVTALYSSRNPAKSWKYDCLYQFDVIGRRRFVLLTKRATSNSNRTGKSHRHRPACRAVISQRKN